MRGFLLTSLVSTALASAVACIPELPLGGDSSSASTAVADAGTADAGLLGGGCGTESNTGIQLCAATTMCPSIVIDTSTMPNCGFRIHNGWADLVCACGTSLCSMGVFDTCDQITALLASQTEAQVCTQVTDGRCEEVSAAAPAPSTSSTSSSSSGATPTKTSTSSSAGGTGCDSQCVKDCGGGAACASVCNCS